ncbi:MAG: flagellar FliJ family protein [Betaproteobacteria bacterium]|jgi:flagellar FliJ protein|uniref:Flagellar FliJ protein n=1 Tax=Thiomonas delicata TaxID=364030 RepID=A0A238D8A4_THIDL|nr:flagellar export protein FliJ [Thiomonas delicata]MDE2128441.1 flagellar FliJ family protein [Betaproteobacteria bacterium]OZB60181.1 MAG: hypothetical protein B7X31_12005 [Thiomonas sp. 13-66-29]SBP89536.1 putative Flagellar FliJ protein [Thiomonas delicata]
MPHRNATPQRIEALQTLHAQAAELGQQIALALKQLKAQHEQAMQKHDSLLSYAQQYRQHLQAIEAQGGDWSKVRDLRAFIAKVGAALAAQQAEINRLQTLHAEQQQAWASARQREKAYELLLAQQHVFVKAHQQRQAQHEMQEWALSPQSQFSTTTQQPTRF